ncbi:MAG: M15 family peptidase [Deltaproteobacteria bacterium]|nr:M15 family peptidase [Deltaproteobacteria bacterium]
MSIYFNELIDFQGRPSSFNHWDPDDPAQKNNSSAFNFRMDTQSPGKASIHGYGLAIDLNPFYNPARVADGKIEPLGAETFLDRSVQHKGMVRENDDVFQFMTRHGWAWGGFFKSGFDPMHFEKIVTRQYIIDSLHYAPNDWGIESSL